MAPSPSKATLQVPLETMIKKERLQEDRPAPRETPCIKKQKKSGNWTKTPVVMDVSEEEGTLVPARFVFLSLCLSSSKNSLTSHLIRERSNHTSYFFCSDAREVMVQDETQSQLPRTVSLLVPLEAFNGTATGEGPLSQHLQNHDPASPAIVEVSCQVLNMNVFTSPNSNGTVSVI